MKCLVCDREMTVFSPSASGGFRSECKKHGGVPEQVNRLRSDVESLRKQLMRERERVERLRAALQQARKYLDGTLGNERPVAVAEIDRTLEGGKQKKAE